MNRRAKKTCTVASGALLLLVAGFSAVSVLSNAPALSSDLRANSILGDWRVQQSGALYHRGTYAFQLGYGFLRTDAVALLTTGEPPENPLDVALNAQRAKDLLEESLYFRPGNAAAWEALAWAEMMLDNPASAGKALETSWKLAPGSSMFAAGRLALVDAIGATDEDEWSIPPEWEELVAADLRALRAFQPGYLRVLLLTSSSLEEIYASLEESDQTE